MVKGLVDIHLRNFESSGVDLIRGHGYFVGPKLIQVDLRDGGTRQLHGNKLSSEPGLVRSSTRFQDSKQQSRSHTLRRWNWMPCQAIFWCWAEVTSGSSSRRPCAGWAAKYRSWIGMLRCFTGKTRMLPLHWKRCSGMKVSELILNAVVEKVSGVSGQTVTLTYLQQGEERTVQGSHLLVAMGRAPNTQGTRAWSLPA